MKKIYISALAVALIGSSAYAQNSITQLNTSKQHNAGDYVPSHGTTQAIPNAGENRVTPFWTEDFSGGSIPANWTNTDDTSAPTELAVFVWSNVSADVAAAALNYLPSSDFMASSASNGYLWCNSDRGLAAAPAVPQHTQLTTTAIDCSGQASVLFSMESLIGVYENNASEFVKLRVSTDLLTWTDFFPFPCLVTGAAAPPCTRWSGNPDLVEVDITSVAANQATVYLQFEWNGGWEYFWAIDDLALSSVPDYERTFLFGVLSHASEGVEYGRIPSGQLGSDFVLGAQVRNFGQMAQTNMTITADVLDPSMAPSFNTSESYASIAPGDTAFMNMAVPLPGTMAQGIYTVNFAVTSDNDADEEDPSDDGTQRTFEINDDLYSVDNLGNHPAGTEITSSLGTASFVGGEDGLIAFTKYDITNDLEVFGLEIDLTPASVAGATLVAALRDTADVNADITTILLAESDLYVLTAADVAAGVVRVPFLNSYTLTPNAYYAGVEMFSNANAEDMGVMDDATTPQPGDVSLIYIAGDQVYGNGNALAIRLVNEPITIGINEVEELSGISVFPNPSNGIFTVNAAVAGVYTVEVTNVIGEIVHAERINGTTSIDMSNVAKGVYMVRVSSETASTVQRVTLK
ncbi:MAG: T9SS type A sorting domain-containing protein [Flavobacteriales bacterium]|nr:T9SS type A sorting domain-containing protein [Flavobacteriales bacterium]